MNRGCIIRAPLFTANIQDSVESKRYIFQTKVVARNIVTIVFSTEGLFLDSR